MRASLAIVAFVTACSSRDAARPPAHDARAATEHRDATGSRTLIVELRWTQVIDRHPRPRDASGDHERPMRKQLEPSSRIDEVFDFTVYDARPSDQRPEIRTKEWLLAMPETGAATFDLVIDAGADYRLLVLANGWKIGADGKVLPDATLRASWQIGDAASGGEGPNQVGLGEAVSGSGSLARPSGGRPRRMATSS